MDFAIGAHRDEPSVLEDLTINGDRVATVKMLGEPRVTIAQRPHELTNILSFNFYLRDTSSQLLQRPI